MNDMGQTGMGIMKETELDMSLENHLTNCWSKPFNLVRGKETYIFIQLAFETSTLGFGQSNQSSLNVPTLFILA